jgi:hypothetical protein
VELLRPLATKRVFTLAAHDLATLLRRVNKPIPLSALSTAAVASITTGGLQPGFPANLFRSVTIACIVLSGDAWGSRLCVELICGFYELGVPITCFGI